MSKAEASVTVFRVLGLHATNVSYTYHLIESPEPAEVISEHTDRSKH